MDSDTRNALTTLIISLVVIAVIVVIYQLNASTVPYVPTPPNPTNQTRTECTPADREAAACSAIYHPVCGWLNPTRVQCLKYPCAQTFGSSCEACINADVSYWTDGICPEEILAS